VGGLVFFFSRSLSFCAFLFLFLGLHRISWFEYHQQAVRRRKKIWHEEPPGEDEAVVGEEEDVGEEEE
jgi:hypothetical protein